VTTDVKMKKIEEVTRKLYHIFVSKQKIQRKRLWSVTSVRKITLLVERVRKVSKRATTSNSLATDGYIDGALTLYWLHELKLVFIIKLIINFILDNLSQWHEVKLHGASSKDG